MSLVYRGRIIDLSFGLFALYSTDNQLLLEYVGKSNGLESMNIGEGKLGGRIFLLREGDCTYISSTGEVKVLRNGKEIRAPTVMMKENDLNPNILYGGLFVSQYFRGLELRDGDTILADSLHLLYQSEE